MSEEVKTTEKYRIYAVLTPTKNVHFFNYFGKVTVITDIFNVETLFPTCLVFDPRLFE